MLLPPERIKILFATENYPKDLLESDGNTYLFRTILHPRLAYPIRSNQLLSNLSSVLGVPIMPSEADTLNEFIMVRRYNVYDTYEHGAAWSTHTPTCCGCGCGGRNRCVTQIIDDINLLNPEQIVFCYKRSNGRLYKRIVAGLNSTIRVVNPVDVYGTRIDDVFVSPTGQWFHDQKSRAGFKTQIERVLFHNILIP